jgi:hypothetical protein
LRKTACKQNGSNPCEIKFLSVDCLKLNSDRMLKINIINSVGNTNWRIRQTHSSEYSKHAPLDTPGVGWSNDLFQTCLIYHEPYFHTFQISAVKISEGFFFSFELAFVAQWLNPLIRNARVLGSKAGEFQRFFLSLVLNNLLSYIIWEYSFSICDYKLSLIHMLNDLFYTHCKTVIFILSLAYLTCNLVYLFLTAGVTGQQRMVTPPWHLILSSHM